MQNPTKIKVSSSNENRTHSRGFTLIELLTVLVVLGVLVATLLPALARSGPNSRSFQCLNNLRQLGVAWRMYGDDNHESLVYSSDDGTGTGNAGNKYAWTQTHMDFAPQQYNWDVNLTLATEPLWTYAGKNAAIYKCPSDESSVFANGVSNPRVRSMSMNFYFGGYAGSLTGAGVPANSYRNFLKTTDLTAPGPASTFVFLDMREDAINWGNFYVNMTGYPSQPAQYEFGDIPNLLHDGGGNFVFGDGHTETHRWFDPRTTPAFRSGSSLNTAIASPRNPDIAWLQNHSTAPK